MAKILSDGRIQVEKGDTLFGIYGANWKTLSGYTGDPAKLQIGTILPAKSGATTSQPLSALPGYAPQAGSFAEYLAKPAPAPAPAPAPTTQTAAKQITFYDKAGKSYPFYGTMDEFNKWNQFGYTLTPDYSGINTPEQATQIINAGQSADALDAQPAVRRDLTEEVKELLAPQTAQPEVPSLVKTFEQLRTDQGIAPLEAQLNELKAQEDEIVARARQRAVAERGKPVAMNVIEGRISEAQRQEQEQLDFVQRQKARVVDELNMRYKTVDNIMKWTDADYDNAVARYDKEFSQNLQILNTVQNIDEAQKSEQERAMDNARANAQIVINTMTSQGITYQSLPAEQQINLMKMGIQSGLGADFFPTVLSVSAGKAILTHIVSSDQTKATIVYKDGTTAVINTGLPPKPVSPVGGFGEPTAAEKSKAMKWLMTQPGVEQEDINKLETDRAFFYWVLNQAEEL